jgi:nucleoside-diphosphate-sugar epimerase
VSHPIIEEDLERIAALELPWSALEGKTVLVSGAAGFLPAYMVETLLRLNRGRFGRPARVIGLVRDTARASQRFADHRGRDDLTILRHDVTQPLPPLGKVDFIIHAASQASPKFFGSDPVGTLSANVLGTHHLLTLAAECRAEGLLFFSTGEVYGRGDASGRPTAEQDYGPLDPLDVRSCYAESKRMGETMCACWRSQFGVPAKIVRPYHTYGPGMRLDDGRVFADFVADVLRGGPIVVRSAGTARRAFCYLTDAVAGCFTVLLAGREGEAYNIGNRQAECSIADLAELLAGLFPERGPIAIQRNAAPGEGYLASPVARSCPDTSKLESLGWRATTGLAAGFRRTVRSYQ